MSYIVRSDKGILLMRITNSQANSIMDNGQGFFRNYESASGLKKTVYELKEDRVVHIVGLQIFLWMGTILVPESD